MSQVQPVFRIYPQFNAPELAVHARLKHRVGERAMPAFPRDVPADRLARALARRRAIDVKELLETAEFFSRTRKRLRAPVVADLCCGHGLAGLLFATEARVEQVLLVDRRRPAAYETILEAVAEVFPEVPDKVRYLELDLARTCAALPRGASVLAVHACGVQTDRCLDIALEIEAGAIAAMPCCYARTARDAPTVLRDQLGVGLMTDVHRTYRLDAAGYRVDWSAIPEAITPMNRILVGVRRG